MESKWSYSCCFVGYCLQVQNRLQYPCVVPIYPFIKHLVKVQLEKIPILTSWSLYLSVLFYFYIFKKGWGWCFICFVFFLSISISIFIQSLCTNRMWDNANFLIGVKLAWIPFFFFSEPGCLTKANEISLSYYLLMLEQRTDGFIPLPKIFA